MTKPISIATLEEFGDAPFFIFCDHASNRIDDHLDCLGIPSDLLETHIAWDIGAGPLAVAIARNLRGTVFSCDFSRLVIDVNRDVAAKDLIPATSDQIPIPGNQMMTADAREARINDYYNPYHDRLEAALSDVAARHDSVFVASIHSFTNRLMGASDERPWKASLLWRHDEPTARAMMAYFNRTTDWQIGDNEPYDARVFNHSIDVHVAPKELRHLTLEIRQDVIDSEAGVDWTAQLLAEGIREIAAQ